MKILRLVVLMFAVGAMLAVLLTAGTPVAMADTLTINHCSDCSQSGPFASVSLTQDGSDVIVVITADSGYTLQTGKMSGIDVFFNSSTSLSKTDITDMSASVGSKAYSDLTFGFSTNKTITGFGEFTDTLTDITGSGLPSSVDSLQFTIDTNVTVAELEDANSDGYTWGAYIVDGGETMCMTSTFPAATATEPASVTLVGLVLLAFIGVQTFSRRKLLA